MSKHALSIRKSSHSRTGAGVWLDALEDRRLMSVGPATIPNATVNDSAYDASTGDLHVIFYNTQAKTLNYQVFHKNGTSGTAQVIDSHSGVGVYSSLAEDSSGILHAAYYDGVNGDLKYAKRSLAGVWSVTTIDSRNTVGLYPSIAISSDGRPAISYYNKTAGDLKFAKYNGSEWVVTTVDSTNDVGRYTSLAVSPTGTLGIGYADSTNGDIKYAESLGNKWGTVIADATIRPGGGYISLGYSPVSHQAAMSYYDAYNGDLKYAERSIRGKWSQFTVVAKNTVGLYSDLAWTFNTDDPAIVFYNKTLDQVQLAYRTGSTWSFEIEATGGGRNVSASDGPSVQGSVPELFLVFSDGTGTNLNVKDIQ